MAFESSARGLSFVINPDGAGLEGPARVLLFGMHGEHQHRKPGTKLFQLLQNFQSAFAGKGQIQHHGIPVVEQRHFNGGIGRAGLAAGDCAGLLLQQPFDAVSNHFVIVDDENFTH